MGTLTDREKMAALEIGEAILDDAIERLAPIFEQEEDSLDMRGIFEYLKGCIVVHVGSDAEVAMQKLIRFLCVVETPVLELAFRKMIDSVGFEELMLAWKTARARAG